MKTDLHLKKTGLVLFSLVFFSFVKAQQGFQKVFGGANFDYAYSAQQTSDKGFVVAGYTRNFGAGNRDFFVLKTDSAGTKTWARTYGGANDDQGYSIQQTSDGGYIMTGYAKSFGVGGYDMLAVKTSATGDTLWAKTYGAIYDDFGNSVRQTSDGGYIFAGYTENFVTAPDSGNAYIIKTDANGNMQWTTSFGGAVGQITDAYSVKQTSDKGYIITGYTNGFGELNGDAYLTKLDSNGTIVFTKTFGGKGADWGNSVLQTSDGGYFITGSNSTDSSGSDLNVYVIKTDANGDTIFTRSFGGTGFDIGQSVQQTDDGGYAVTGYSSSFGSDYSDVFLLKLDANGNAVFGKKYGGAADDEGNFIAKCSDGGFAIAGICMSYGAGGYDFYFIRTDSLGNSTCNDTAFMWTENHLLSNNNSVTALLGTGIPTVMAAQPLVDSGGVLDDPCNPTGIFSVTDPLYFFNIFPNPNNGSFVIASQNNSGGDVKIKITNALGEIIYSSRAENKSGAFSKSIDLAHLPAGIYFVTASENGKTFSRKIFIEK